MDLEMRIHFVESLGGRRRECKRSGFMRERGVSTTFGIARVKQSGVLHRYVYKCMCVFVMATPSTRVGIVQIKRICGICAHLLALMPGLSAEYFEHQRRCSLHAVEGVWGEIKLQLKNSGNVPSHTNIHICVRGRVWEGRCLSFAVKSVEATKINISHLSQLS